MQTCQYCQKEILENTILCDGCHQIKHDEKYKEKCDQCGEMVAPHNFIIRKHGWGLADGISIICKKHQKKR